MLIFGVFGGFGGFGYFWSFNRGFCILEGIYLSQVLVNLPFGVLDPKKSTTFMNFIRFDNKIEAYDVAIVFMSKLDFKNFPKSSNPKISKIKKKSLKSICFINIDIHKMYIYNVTQKIKGVGCEMYQKVPPDNPHQNTLLGPKRSKSIKSVILGPKNLQKCHFRVQNPQKANSLVPGIGKYLLKCKILD